MTSVQAIQKVHIEKLMKNEFKYTFTELMIRVRKCLFLSRRDVTSYMDVSENKLVYLEYGKYRFGPDRYFVIDLARFYGIDKDIVVRKLDEYLDNHRQQVQEWAKKVKKIKKKKIVNIKILLEQNEINPIG